MIWKIGEWLSVTIYAAHTHTHARTHTQVTTPRLREEEQKSQETSKHAVFYTNRYHYTGIRCAWYDDTGKSREVRQERTPDKKQETPGSVRHPDHLHTETSRPTDSRVQLLNYNYNYGTGYCTSGTVYKFNYWIEFYSTQQLHTYNNYMQIIIQIWLHTNMILSTIKVYIPVIKLLKWYRCTKQALKGNARSSGTYIAVFPNTYHHHKIVVKQLFKKNSTALSKW